MRVRPFKYIVNKSRRKYRYPEFAILGIILEILVIRCCYTIHTPTSLAKFPYQS